ncbi:microtubule-associated protein Jupiter isoform X2 [Planococcus citri]|uniref:microtubule-associated protein Jupiter isoform X2 n=1 Tax=Planococcus citri TaxID=170843 RepID=UPI0031F92B94
MATYAAYRHIELDKVGAGKKRVLKPPGGGSSDIFGKDGGPEQPVIRKKSQQSSSIVLNDEVTPAPIENGHSNKQGTCNERLFGPALELNGIKNGINSVAKINGNGEILTNGKDHTDAPKTNGVPVTNGKAPSEAPKPVVSNAGNAAPRQRVPPGGFSSGLW